MTETGRGGQLADREIALEVDGVAGVFERSNVTGRAVLRLGDESTTLASPWDPRTHVSASTIRTLEAHLDGHYFVDVKNRPRVAAPVREAGFTICVDGQQFVAESGR